MCFIVVLCAFFVLLLCVLYVSIAMMYSVVFIVNRVLTKFPSHFTCTDHSAQRLPHQCAARNTDLCEVCVYVCVCVCVYVRVACFVLCACVCVLFILY